MALPAELLISLWDRAKEAEIGIALTVAGSIEGIKGELNQIRKQLNEPELYELAICLPEGGKEIWIVKKGTDLDD